MTTEGITTAWTLTDEQFSKALSNLEQKVGRSAGRIDDKFRLVNKTVSGVGKWLVGENVVKSSWELGAKAIEAFAEKSEEGRRALSQLTGARDGFFASIGQDLYQSGALAGMAGFIDMADTARRVISSIAADLVTFNSPFGEGSALEVDFLNQENVKLAEQAKLRAENYKIWKEVAALDAEMAGRPAQAAQLREQARHADAQRAANNKRTSSYADTWGPMATGLGQGWMVGFSTPDNSKEVQIELDAEEALHKKKVEVIDDTEAHRLTAAQHVNDYLEADANTAYSAALARMGGLEQEAARIESEAALGKAAAETWNGPGSMDEKFAKIVSLHNAHSTNMDRMGVESLNAQLTENAGLTEKLDLEDREARMQELRLKGRGHEAELLQIQLDAMKEIEGIENNSKLSDDSKADAISRIAKRRDSLTALTGSTALDDLRGQLASATGEGSRTLQGGLLGDFTSAVFGGGTDTSPKVVDLLQQIKDLTERSNELTAQSLRGASASAAARFN